MANVLNNNASVFKPKKDEQKKIETPVIKQASIPAAVTGGLRALSTGTSNITPSTKNTSASEFKPAAKTTQPTLSSMSIWNDKRKGIDWSSASPAQRAYNDTYYKTLDEPTHTKMFRDLQSFTYRTAGGADVDKSEAIRKSYKEGTTYLDNELKDYEKRYGKDSYEYKALKQFKGDYESLGRQVMSKNSAESAAHLSRQLDDTIDSVFAGYMSAPDYQAKVEKGKKEILGNPRKYGTFTLGMKGASEKQKDLLYAVFAEEGEKGAEDFYRRFLNPTVSRIGAAQEFSETIASDSKAKRALGAIGAAVGGAVANSSILGGGVQKGIDVLTGKAKALDDDVLAGDFTVQDSVDNALRREFAGINQADLDQYGLSGLDAMKGAHDGKKTSTGQYGLGNIDLTNRDTGLYDEDGNLMTVKSMSFEEDGKEILVPTIVKKNGKWVELSDKEAIDWYHRTGEYLGKFDTVDQANAYAQRLHQDQQQLYTDYDWLKSVEEEATDYQKQLLGYVYMASDRDEAAARDLWEAIKARDSEIRQTVNGGTYGTTSRDAVQSGLYQEYLDKNKLMLGMYKAAVTTGSQLDRVALSFIPVVGQALNLGTMGLSVFGNVYSEDVLNGREEDWKTAGHALTSAALEVVMEKLLSGVAHIPGIAVDEMSKRFVKNIANPWVRAAANTFLRFQSEGLEEGLTDAANALSTGLWFGEGDIASRAKQGFELDDVDLQQMLESYFYGGISAIFLGGLTTAGEVVADINYRELGHHLNTLESTDKLIDTILNTKIDEKAGKSSKKLYDEAKELAQGMKDGKLKKNDVNVGEMFANFAKSGGDVQWLTNPDTVNYNKDTLTEENFIAGATSRLAELGADTTLATDIARWAMGQAPSQEAFNKIKSDPRAAQVLQELIDPLDMEKDTALTRAVQSTTRNVTGDKTYDTLVASNPDQTVVNPATQQLISLGVELEEAQGIGDVIAKVMSGESITEDEAELISVSNAAVRSVLSEVAGVELSENATIGAVMDALNGVAAEAAKVKEQQAAVAKGAEAAARARMPIPPNTSGTVSMAGVEMTHDQFIERFMQKPGATLEQAEEAWNRNRTVSAALNGEEENNGTTPGKQEGRNPDLAGRSPIPAATQRTAGSGRAADAGGTEQSGRVAESGQSADLRRGYTEDQVIKAFNSKQRAFMRSCLDAGFKTTKLIKGPILRKGVDKDGNPVTYEVNALVDDDGNLVIRWDNPYASPLRVALHERIHLWLSSMSDSERSARVKQALQDIFGDNTAAFDAMYKAYADVYAKAYTGLTGEVFAAHVMEEMLADMYAGMNNYGANAGSYQSQAEMYVQQSGLREKFFGEEGGFSFDEQFSLNDPFRGDVDRSKPPETRPFPGEKAMHDNMELLSLTSMAQGANFELRLNSQGQPYELIDKKTGKRVEHVTGEMMIDTPLGNIVQLAVDNGNIDADEAAQQRDMLASAMNLIVDYDDAALVWELVGSQMFSAVKANSDKQYNKTIDFSTICKKTMAIVDAMSETMKKLGRGLTRREVEIVYEEVGKKGLATPCPVCYVFSRWMGIGGLLDQMNRFQVKYGDMSEEDIVAFMTRIENEAYEYARKNPKSTYYDKNGNFLIGKVISDMKSKPNGKAARAIETLNAHQQALATIAELEKAKAKATPAMAKRYGEMIRQLRYNVKSEKALAEAEAKMQAAEAEVEPYEEYQWLAKTMMISDSSQVNEDGESIGNWKKNPNFRPVPKDILFDLNKGGEFAKDYPLSWAFRTGKGCAAGKAISPYSDARVGETIQGVATDVKNIRVELDESQHDSFVEDFMRRNNATKEVAEEAWQNRPHNEFLTGDTKTQQKTLKSARKNQRRQNLIGGMRYQSTSDFRYEFGSDYLITFLEMQALGANVQLYTKVIEAVDFLASTGADCNLSVMSLGDGYEEYIDPETGKTKLRLKFSDITGINADAAIKKSREYDNVQLILVGINDTNIRLALEGDEVTFVIPFHGSGQSVHQIQTLMDLIGEHLDVTQAQDYTSVQSDRAIKDRAEKHPELQAMWDLRMDIIMGKFLTDEQKETLKAWENATSQEEKTALANRLAELGKAQEGLSAEQKARLAQNKHLQKLYDMFYVDTTDPAFYNNLAKDQAEHIFPYEYWIKDGDYAHADENGRVFQEYCASIGVIPRFSGINSKYQKTGFGDFTQDKGYWKLLIDRSMYENVYNEKGDWIGYGKYRPQQQINMTNIDIGDLSRKAGEAQFTNGEMSKQYDATRNSEDLAKRDNIVSDSIKRIEAMRGSADVVEKNALDRTRVKKDFREKVMKAQSALREANQTAEPESEVVERLSIADGEPKPFRPIAQTGKYQRASVADTASSTQLTEKQQANVDFNNSQTEVGGELHHLSGDEQKRYKNNVGKEVRGKIYAHKQYADEVVQDRELLTNAETALKEAYPDFKYNCIMYDPKTGSIRFDEAPDFDTADEPIPGWQITVTRDGEVKKPRYESQIWHHKWQWVKNDYTGFDVEESWDRSRQYLNHLRPVDVSEYRFSTSKNSSGFAQRGIPDARAWGEQLRHFGLDDMIHDERWKQNGPEVSHAERYSLAPVNPVRPTSEEWTPSHTVEDAKAAFKDFWNVDAEESDDGNPTQRASTVSTYRKIYKILQNQGFNGTILDASSGFGIGTDVGRREFGYDVDDIEPFPSKTKHYERVGDKYEKFDGPYVPRYTDYSAHTKKYDAIISSAVLNVLPQDQRDALVVKMGEMLNPGGQMFITTRGTKGDVDNLARTGENIQLGPSEFIETVYGSYQKGFTNTELKAYLEDALGPDFTVELSNKSNGGKFNNNTSIVVTKNGATRNEAETAQERYSVMDQEHNDWAPEFYSKMERVVNDWTNGKGQPLGAKMAANQVVGWLKGKGVKSEEIKWSGIVPYLEGKKTVTKEELQQVMAENEVKIETKVLNNNRVFKTTYDYDRYRVTEDEFIDLAVRALNENPDYNSFRKDDAPFTAKDVEIYPQYDGSIAALFAETGEVLLEGKPTDEMRGTNWSEYTLDGGENYREILFKMPAIENYTNRAMSTHWEDDTGVIVHTRVQDMGGLDGGKVLFVEEVQSDLHNAGANNTFGAETPEIQELATLWKKMENIDITDAEVTRLNELQNKYGEKEYQKYKQLDKKREEEVARVKEIAMGVQDMLPEDYWVSTYRLSRWLYDYFEGKEYNIFPSSVGSKERSEAAKKLILEYLSDQDIAAIKQANDTLRDYRVAREKYIKKIRGAMEVVPDVPFAGAANTYHELVMKHLLRLAAEGDYDAIAWTTADHQKARWKNDAEAGYGAFEWIYDTALPKFMNKYGKQWGSKVGSTVLENGEEVWSVDITPEMKDSVLHEGQPRFSVAPTNRPTENFATEEEWRDAVANNSVEYTPEMEEYWGLSGGDMVDCDAAICEMLDRFDEIHKKKSWFTKDITNLSWYKEGFTDFIDLLKSDFTHGPDMIRFMIRNLDERNLSDLKWFPIQALDGETRKTYRKYINQFNKIIDTRIEEVAAQKGIGRNLHVSSRKEYTLSDIRSMFDELNADAETAAIADKVFSWAEKMEAAGYPIPFKFKTLEGNGGEQLGGKVRYNTAYFNDPSYSDTRKAQTLLHEIIHVYSADIIELVKGYNNWEDYSRYSNGREFVAAHDSIPQDVVEAVKTLDQIWGQIRYDPLFTNPETGKRMYGTTSTSEMIAELANPEFREALKKKSLLQKILDAVKKLFGIDTTNAYDAVSAGFDKLMTATANPDFQTANQKYNRTHSNFNRFSVAPDKKNPFPEGSAEQQMLDMMNKADNPDALEDYINGLIEKRNQSIEHQKEIPPALPRDTLFPVNSKQKEIAQNQLDSLIKKYGLLQKGEKAARDKSYPERTSDTQFVRRTARTAAEAAGIPEYFADQIDQAVLNELLTYTRITDKMANNKSDKEYSDLGYKKAIKEWNENRASTNSRPDKYDIAFGERLLIEASRNNDAAVAMKVLADLAAMATQAGQVVQAVRMLKDMGPIGQLYYVQKAVDRINKDNAGRIAKGSFQPITIDQKLAEAVVLSNTQKEMEDNMKVLIKSIADQLPVTLKDKWDAWRYLAMLGNPRTHVRNLTGNAIFVPVRFVKDMLAAAGEQFIDPNERTKSVGAKLHSAKYADVREYAKQDFKNMEPYITTGGKMNPLNEIMEARTIFKTPILGQALEKLRRLNDWALNKEDIIFLRGAYIDAFTQFVAARGLTAEQLTGPDGGATLNEARQYAALEAQKATYRDFSRLATALNGLRKVPVLGTFLDGLLPFTKTPINILKRGVEYSPVGLAHGVYDALFKVRRGDISAAQAIDEMASGLTGTGVAILGYILASMGLARGADDDDKKKQDLEEAQGHQSYSLEIGDNSYTIDWAAPVALPFFVGVEAHKQMAGDGEGSFWDFCNAMTLLMEPMMSLSMLDGINSTLAAVKSDQNSPLWAVLSNVMASYVSQGAPTFGGQVARTFDPDRRSTYVDKNIEGPALLQRTLQGIQGKVPGLAKEKMAYVDVWGRKDTSSSALWRAFENFASPGYGNKIKETPVDTELMRLYDATGDNSVLPSTVAKYFQVEGERLDLTAKQYEKYKTTTGQTAFKLIGELIDDPVYGSMNDAQKADTVKQLLEAATIIGKQAVAPNYKGTAWVERAVAQDNLETAAVFHTIKAQNAGLSSYQLIESMAWLTPEEQGKLIMSERNNAERKMTDYTKKKYKFILTDEQIAREREIYNGMFWPAYNELIYSPKFLSADVAARSTMISEMQEKLNKASRMQLGDELRAEGYTSVLEDDSDVPEQPVDLYSLLNRG